MPSSTANSEANVADEEERPLRPDPVLAGAPMLIGFAFMMGIVITVVFPSGREYAEVTSKQKVDAYSIAYLSVVTRADPKDSHLRMVYVRQLAHLGRWDDALKVLDEDPTPAKTSPEANDLRMELILSRARSIPESDPEARTVAFAAVHEELRRLAAAPPKGRARELAKLALELEDPRLAASFFEHAGNEESDPNALAEAGRWYRASGEGARAGECLRRAGERAQTPEEKMAFIIAAASAVEETEGACAAWKMLEPTAAQSNDLDFLRRATETARRCARPQDAKLLGRRILSQKKDDEEEIKAQIRRELEAGDSPGALALLRSLLAKHPNDLRIREATARVAEWAGQPAIALEQWLFLFEAGKTPSPTLVLP